jgi:hypothetical protein
MTRSWRVLRLCLNAPRSEAQPFGKHFTVLSSCFRGIGSVRLGPIMKVRGYHHAFSSSMSHVGLGIQLPDPPHLMLVPAPAPRLKNSINELGDELLSI